MTKHKFTLYGNLCELIVRGPASASAVVDQALSDAEQVAKKMVDNANAVDPMRAVR